LRLRPGSDPLKVIASTNKSLASSQQIRRWIEWPDADFPRTSTQKIRKNEIATRVAAELNNINRKPATSPLTAIISRLSNSRNVLADARLDEDLNLDSLSRVELMSAIEDRYQIDLDEQSFTESTTVGELEQLILDEGSHEPDEARFSY